MGWRPSVRNIYSLCFLFLSCLLFPFPFRMVFAQSSPMWQYPWNPKVVFSSHVDLPCSRWRCPCFQPPSLNAAMLQVPSMLACATGHLWTHLPSQNTALLISYSFFRTHTPLIILIVAVSGQWLYREETKETGEDHGHQSTEPEHHFPPETKTLKPDR